MCGFVVTITGISGLLSVFDYMSDVEITEKQPLATVYCWLPTAMMDWSHVWILCCSGIWGSTPAGFTCTVKCLPAATKCLRDMSYESRQFFAILRCHIQNLVRTMIPGSQLLVATRPWDLSSINVILHLKMEPFLSVDVRCQWWKRR